MAQGKQMSWALVYTVLYALLMIALQFILGQAMPNTGMGRLAVSSCS